MTEELENRVERLEAALQVITKTGNDTERRLEDLPYQLDDYVAMEVAKILNGNGVLDTLVLLFKKVEELVDDKGDILTVSERALMRDLNETVRYIKHGLE